LPSSIRRSKARAHAGALRAFFQMDKTMVPVPLRMTMGMMFSATLTRIEIRITAWNAAHHQR